MFFEIRVIMFSINLDAEGTLLLIMRPLEDNPEANPLFIYDGSDTALLFRSFESVHILTGMLKITPDCREALNTATDIQVIEFDDVDVVRVYSALIEWVPDIREIIGGRA